VSAVRKGRGSKGIALTKAPSLRLSKAPSLAVAAVQLPASTLYSTEPILDKVSVAVPVKVGVLSSVGSGVSAVIVTDGAPVSTVKPSLA